MHIFLMLFKSFYKKDQFYHLKKSVKKCTFFREKKKTFARKLYLASHFPSGKRPGEWEMRVCL